MISDGKAIYLTGYKKIYALKPGQGPAVNGIIQAPKKAKQPAKKKSGKKKG